MFAQYSLPVLPRAVTVLFTRKSFVLLLLISTWCSTRAEQNSPSLFSSSLVFDFDPPNEIYVKEEEEWSISFSVQTNASLEFDNDTWTTPTGTLFVRAEPSFRLEVIQGSFEVSLNDFMIGFNKTFKVKGILLGHAKLEFYWVVYNKQLPTTTARTPTTIAGNTTTIKLTTDMQTVATVVPEPISPSDTQSDTSVPPEKANSTINESVDNLKMVILTEMPSNVEETKQESVTGQPQNATTKKSKRNPKKHRSTVMTTTTADTNTLINEEKNDEFTLWLKRKKRETITDSSKSATSTEKMIKPILLSNTYKVHVVRKRSMLDTIFMLVVGLFVVINVTMMGCEIEVPIVWKVLKKPIGPAVGFVSQFAFMPLASYGLGQALLQESTLQLGLFTLGCSPGGSGSNFWTLLLHGDINLSVTMTFISTLSAMFMMPLWLYTLGQSIISRTNIQIPFLSLITSLITFCIPVSIGVAIRHYRPSWAKVAKKLIRPFTIILIITLNVFAFLTSTYVFKLMTWQMLVCGMCVAWGGYGFGALLAWICRLSRPQIIAVSIETAIQNAGIAFMVLGLTLKEPDSDLSSVAPVAQLMVTGLPLLFGYLIYKTILKIKGCLCRKKDHQVEERQKDIDVVEPLVINRTSISPPSYSKRNTDVDNSNVPNSEHKKMNNVPQKPDIDTTTPIYANMYQEFDNNYYENAYTKPKVQLKLSTGESKYDVPRFQMRTFEEEVDSDESEENTRESDEKKYNA